MTRIMQTRLRAQIKLASQAAFSAAHRRAPPFQRIPLKGNSLFGAPHSAAPILRFYGRNARIDGKAKTQLTMLSRKEGILKIAAFPCRWPWRAAPKHRNKAKALAQIEADADRLKRLNQLHQHLAHGAPSRIFTEVRFKEQL